MGVFLYLIFRSQLLVLLFYVAIAELIIYLLYFKYHYEYNPFIRLAYNTCLFLGYFSGVILYGTIENYDPNVPNFFH